MNRVDTSRQLLHLAVDRRDLLLGVAQLGARQLGSGRRMAGVRRIGGGGGVLLLAEPEVLVDPAGQVPQMAVENGVLLIGDPLEQIAVVRDDEQRPWPR